MRAVKLQQNPVVRDWGCWLTQVVLYNCCKTVVVVVAAAVAVVVIVIVVVVVVIDFTADVRNLCIFAAWSKLRHIINIGTTSGSRRTPPVELCSSPTTQSGHHLRTVQTTAEGTPFSRSMNAMAICDFDMRCLRRTRTYLLTYLHHRHGTTSDSGILIFWHVTELWLETEHKQ